MSEPIMFKGREVVAVKTDKAFPQKCSGCVGKIAFSKECKLLEKCGKNYGNVVFQYARPAKRKVAKCEICKWRRVGGYYFCTDIRHVDCASRDYASRKAAIRGARRFCKSIGYKCEIVKG